MRYDRHWALLDGGGEALTLKRCPALALLRPAVDLDRGVLSVRSVAGVGCGGVGSPLELPLQQQQQEEGCGTAAGAKPSSSGRSSFEVRVCARNVCAARVGAPVAAAAAADVSSWFEAAIGIPCQLVCLAEEQGAQSVAGGSSGAAAPVAFANEAQLLAVSSTSLQDLHRRSGSREPLPSFARRFRPNLVLGPDMSTAAAAGSKGAAAAEGSAAAAAVLPPYCEDRWRAVQLGGQTLVVAGPCARCDVVCYDPQSGRSVGTHLVCVSASLC